MTTLELLPLHVDLSVYDLDGDMIELEFVDEDDAALDVSDYDWASQWRHDRADDEAVDLEVDQSDAAIGFVRVSISADIKTDIAARRGHWDVQGTLPASDPLTVIEGAVRVTRDVTRVGS